MWRKHNTRKLKRKDAQNTEMILCVSDNTPSKGTDKWIKSKQRNEKEWMTE